MPLYKKILVTIDCSPVDDAIVAHVADLARIHGAAVFLLHAVHSHTLDEDSALSEKARCHLKSHAERLAAEGVEVAQLVRSGEPFPVILKEIQEGDYDLVAMATHGHGMIGDLLYGSVSDKLKHAIDVPLLLIKAD